MTTDEQNLLRRLGGPQSRRQFMLRAGAAGLGATALPAFLEACGGTSSSTASVNLSGPIPMETLIANAKKEGSLQAIGIPPEWADYQDILTNYSAKYVPVDYKAEAEYSSAQEVEVFKQSKQHPHGDIGDVGFIWGRR